MKTAMTFAVLACFASAVSAQEARRIAFPDTKDGRHVMSVDTHTHTVFSDGEVWPNIRVLEAQRDGLDVLAITEHIDTQAKGKDIPHPDRNRSFEIAREAAKNTNVLVVEGVEIYRPDTRCKPDLCAHFNAIFLKDANPLRHREWPEWLDRKDEAPLEAIRVAKKQGAFIIWNHPAHTPGGRLQLLEYHEPLLRDRVVDGIEVVNGDWYSEDAFQFALDRNLAVIGASDVHGLIDYSTAVSDGGQRSVTLVIADNRSEAAVKSALAARRTVALFKHTLIGREQEVRAIVEAALTLEVNDPAAPTSLVFRNASSSPFSLRRIGGERGRTQTAGSIIVVPAHGEVSIRFYGVDDGQPLSFEFEVFNALTAPGQALRLTLPVLVK